MATAEKTEFTFPDETEQQLDKPTPAAAEKPDAVEIQVVDDTPPADRGRKPMAQAPEDPTDEELAGYSDSVKKRLQHFTKGYHEERRAKEAAQREKDEAIRIAQALARENQNLQGSLSQGQQALVAQAKTVVTSEIDEAKRKMKAAQDAFDNDAFVEAQQELMKATLKEERLQNWRPAPSQTPQNVVQTQQAQPAAPAQDPKAVAWLEKNSWFGEDDEMSSFAMGVHNKLVRDGVNPTSDDYYDRLNRRMREVFPAKFEAEEPVDTPRKQTNVVASATRSTAPKKIVLTQTQVSLAKRLGISLETYAREVAKEARKTA